MFLYWWFTERCQGFVPHKTIWPSPNVAFKLRPFTQRYQKLRPSFWIILTYFEKQTIADSPFLSTSVYQIAVNIQIGLVCNDTRHGVVLIPYSKKVQCASSRRKVSSCQGNMAMEKGEFRHAIKEYSFASTLAPCPDLCSFQKIKTYSNNFQQTISQRPWIVLVIWWTSWSWRSLQWMATSFVHWHVVCRVLRWILELIWNWQLNMS